MASMPACAATELVAKGRESAALLKAMLGHLPAVVGAGAGATTTPHGLRDLAEQILRCCDRALAALHRGTGTEEAAGSSRKRKPELDGGQLARPPVATGSKRMRMSRGERGTRVEKRGTMEDGFIWRKYGQKDIHGSNYPRLYFRCTYKDDRGCMARRQVQQSDTNPGVYLITYFDEHTCCRDGAVEPPPPFVINFGFSAASTDEHQPIGGCSPWPSSSCEDDGVVPVEMHTSSALCSSPEEELLQAGMSCNVAEFIVEQSTPPVPELMGMMRLPQWEWDPMNGRCLDWEFPKSESSFDIEGFVRYDFDTDLL